MIREKIYELKQWKGVVHTTWNPKGPGVIRIHLIPPKFRPFKVVPSTVILNGKDVLPINEAWAILLTEFGIDIEVRSLKSHIELYPIDATEFGIIVVLHPAINSFVAVSIIALQLLRESYTVFPLSTIIDIRLLQP